MPGIQSLKHIHCLTSSYLPYHDSVRPHPERCFYQIPDTDRYRTFHICHFCLQPDQIFHALNFQFRVILNSDDPLIFRNIIRQSSKKRSFAASCTTAYDYRIPGPYQSFQKPGTFTGKTSKRDQSVHCNGSVRKSSYGKNRTVQRHRANHCIYSGSVLQSGIHNRHGFIDHSVAPSCNLLDHILKLFPGGKAFIPFPKPSSPLHKDRIRTVYHNLCYCFILDQFLKYIQLAHRIKQFLPELKLFIQRYIRIPHTIQDKLVNLIQYLSVSHFSGHIQFFHQKISDRLKSLPVHMFSFLISSFTYSPS